MQLKMPTPAACAECGDGAIFHRVTYVSIIIDELLKPFSRPGPFLRGFTRFVYGIEANVTPYILEAFMHFGWARRVTEPDDETQLLAVMLWNEAKERGITVEEVRLFGLARNLFLATYPDGHRFAYEGIPTPAEGDLRRAPWMDDKAELKKRFRKLGLPVAKGGAVGSERAARALAATLKPPLIAKPFSGSASRHTVLHLMDGADVARGFHIAHQVAPKVVLEEELTGAVYRATVVDGIFAASLRRDQPQVVGDGERTVDALVAEANEHPRRQGPYFHRIKLDAAAEEELRWQGLTPESVPTKGQRVTLHQKINWSVGGTTCDVTEETHPDNIALFEEVARILKAPIVGLDFIIEDIGKSWKDQERCGILECNSMPFFDNHHLPFEGKPRNVAARIWNMHEASRLRT